VDHVNEDTLLTLDDAVEEVLGQLTGLELTYEPELSRYRAITRALNKALRLNALEHEWSYYSSVEEVGTSVEGQTGVLLTSTMRPRVTGDDSLRFVDDNDVVRLWAYFLPRDALHKYRSRGGLWCAATRDHIEFSRPLTSLEAGFTIQVPIMREPTMFVLPDQPEDPDEELVDVPDEVRQQLVDFVYPDVITMRAAYLYAQTDPVMQPRVQTLEAQYKDLMYQIIERDDRSTDSPYMNEWFVPVSGSIEGSYGGWHLHPFADERR